MAQALHHVWGQLTAKMLELGTNLRMRALADLTVSPMSTRLLMTNACHA